MTCDYGNLLWGNCVGIFKVQDRVPRQEYWHNSPCDLRQVITSLWASVYSAEKKRGKGTFKQLLKAINTLLIWYKLWILSPDDAHMHVHTQFWKLWLFPDIPKTICESPKTIWTLDLKNLEFWWWDCSHVYKKSPGSSRCGSVVNESDWEPWGCGFYP